MLECKSLSSSEREREMNVGVELKFLEKLRSIKLQRCEAEV